MEGIDKLGLPHDRIPQLGEINKVLAETTGWQVARVPALIPFQTFFELLANKQFPVATFYSHARRTRLPIKRAGYFP